MHIRKNDLVIVITGEDKEFDKENLKPKKVLRVLLKKNKVVVEGSNFVYKHVKRSQKHREGGRIRRESPIDVSNVMLWCDNCERPSRISIKREGKNRKRTCKVCQKEIPSR